MAVKQDGWFSIYRRCNLYKIVGHLAYLVWISILIIKASLGTHEAQNILSMVVFAPIFFCLTGVTLVLLICSYWDYQKAKESPDELGSATVIADVGVFLFIGELIYIICQIVPMIVRFT